MSSEKVNKSHLYIFTRAATIVLCTTISVYLISSGIYWLAIAVSMIISYMWTLNIKDLSVSSSIDRLSYIIGGAFGTTIALYGLRPILKIIFKI